jgi:poly-beta-1,6-N-acetyl-D-glucosamine N-deacetylase
MCATQTPASTDRLAQIAVKLGLKEAVLLDSGYSTSLIYGRRVLAVGHRTKAVASRPVPHAIVLFNPKSQMVQASSKPSKPKL